MESTEKRDGCERSSDLHGTTKRRVLSESQMGTSPIVIVGVGSEDPTQMGLAQDQDMVEALSPDRADEPFNGSVLPGRARRSWSVPDAHGSKTSRYHIAIRSISVPNEVLRCLIPEEGLVIWRAIQSAVGLAVTLIQTRWRRSRRMITNP
jgi:hypothetical protein